MSFIEQVDIDLFFAVGQTVTVISCDLIICIIFWSRNKWQKHRFYLLFYALNVGRICFGIEMELKKISCSWIGVEIVWQGKIETGIEKFRESEIGIWTRIARKIRVENDKILKGFIFIFYQTFKHYYYFTSIVVLTAWVN